jgi:hypothetical protein
LEDEKPGGFLFLIDGYKEEVDISRKMGATASNEVIEMWSQLLVDGGSSTSRQSASPGTRTYTPGTNLLGSLAWGQDVNNDGGCTPAYNDEIKKKWNHGWFSACTCQSPPVGCGAVAMGQVMWYWKWPQSSTYRTYNWNQMPVALTNSSTTAQGEAVAKLLLDCAESSNMVYACGGSFTTSIESALKNTFGYTAITGNNRNNYTDTAWDNLIRTEIDNERPVIYYGEKAHISSEKHYFVIDGYESLIKNNHFHINFGWRGKHNDIHFYLNNINPGTYNFSNHHYAFTNIRPSLTISGPNTVCYSGNSFTLDNAPSSTIFWTVSNTGIFTVNSSGNPTTVTRTGTGTGSVTLSARFGSVTGPVIASKTITPCMPTVTGPDLVCSSGSVFTVSNYPPGATLSWACSQYMTTQGANGNSTMTFKTTGSGDEYGWVGVYVNGTLFKKDVVAGTPRPEFDFPSDFCANQWYWLPYKFPIPAGTYFIWDSSGLATFEVEDYGINVLFPGLPGSQTLYCTVTNGCGTKTYSMYNAIVKKCRSGSSDETDDDFRVYPNPVSDIIHIEIDQDAITRAQSLQSGAPTFDIRLYDGYGNLLRQATNQGSSTVQINVSNLPNDIYYLHIYDGTNNVPEMRQIMVRH